MTHIVFLFALICAYPELNKKYPFYIFSFSTLFLFLALRYDYGNDYMSYYQIHSALNAGLPAWGQNDILFAKLNLLIPNYYWFIAVISAFYIYTFYFLIKNNLKVKEYWLALALLLLYPYFFLVQLSGIRQTIAICFGIFAIHFGINKRLIFYYLFVFIATGFHASALILVPIYFILNDNHISIKWIIGIIILVGLLLFTDLFYILSYKLLEYFPANYIGYFEQGLYNSIRATLISSVFFVIILFNLKRLKGKELIYGKLSLIGTIIWLLGYRVSMLTRMGKYFDIFIILTIPHILSRINLKTHKIMLISIILLIVILRYYSFFSNPLWSGSYGVYKTILNK